MGEFSAFEADQKTPPLLARVPLTEKSLSASCGMQLDKEETKEVTRFVTTGTKQKVATVERGLQVSPELTHSNLLQFSPPQAGFFKVPKMKKKQRAKDRQLEAVTKPRKRIFHEANYSDLDRYDFAVQTLFLKMGGL